MSPFIKYNRSHYKDQLIAEAQGLEELRIYCDDSLLKLPGVLSVNEEKIELTAIQAKPFSSAQFCLLGQGLANLHAQRQKRYGFAADNYIGLNPQPNGWSDNWGQFFIQQRLGFQLSLVKNHELRCEFQSLLEKQSPKLESFLNDNCPYPSLVHGDLWSGNVLADGENVWLIDPAVYYADRELDLAMTEMFGGFADSFYQAYDQALPRSAAYPQKQIIYNLYHYLNHYNLFGSSYLDACYRGFAFIGKL